MYHYLSIFITIFLSFDKASGGCYFPVDVQGEYVTQSMIDSEIAYTSVTITYDSIPGWGRCFSRLGARGHNHVLQDVTVNGDSCYKCVKIQVRSPNVVQVHTLDSVYQCHTSPEEARRGCPSKSDIRDNTAREVMLYKTRGYYGARDNFVPVLCPIFGTWRFSYTDTSDTSLSCSNPASRASNCHSGYKLELQFKGCNYPDHQLQFKCLGSWTGEDGQEYVSLLDTKLVQLDEAPHPRYRCGIYKHDTRLGVTWLSLSNDSTCLNQLWSHNKGHQTIQLHNLKPSSRVERRCNIGGYTLPKWSQGNWGEARVQAGNMIYRDNVNFVQYELTAVSGTGNPGRFLVKVEAGQCGAHSGYACLAMERRNDNVMEMMLGHVVSRYEHGDMLCSSSESFAGKHWTTLTRLGHAALRGNNTCPLVGQYSGTLPDGEGLCARSTTLCNKPDMMRYEVYNCNNITEVYEERLYRCYGVFQENGLTYTAVRRLDLPNKECFVGITVMNETEKVHKIIEAGTDCGRGKDPEATGMVLKFKSDHCDINDDEEDANDTDDNPVNLGKLPCDNEVINNELNNADIRDDNDNDYVEDNNSEGSIDRSYETEAVDQTVTQISGSTKEKCHLWTLMTLTVILLNHL